MKETTVSTSGNGIFSKAFSEIRHFGTYPFNMRILLLTNMLYAFVLPVVELFVGTYIMRNSSELWATSWPSTRASRSPSW